MVPFLFTKTTKMKNAISWFEIPTNDIERAQKFYEAIFQIKLEPLETENFKMRMFPLDDPLNGVGGTLVKQMAFTFLRQPMVR